MDEPVDCRSEVGVTVGLIDSLITICRILRTRDMTNQHAIEALVDLHFDEDVEFVRRYAEDVRFDSKQ